MSRHSRRPAAASNGRPKAAIQPSIASIDLSSSAWGAASGSGRVAFSLYAALQRIGINVSMLGKPGLTGPGPDLPEPPSSVEADARPSPDVVLHIGEPPTWKPVEGKRNVALTWWPFSAIPTAWLPHLYGMQTLFVPSRWCADGVKPAYPQQEIKIVPLGLDAETFQPVGPPRERREQLRILFFDNRADEYRAGADVAVAAFMRAFPNRDDVAMDVWSTAPANVYAPDQRIQLRRHIGDDRELVRFYRRYDALAFSVRGTGFGLAAIEAAAVGLPVMHSGQGGLEHLADVGTLIGARKTATVRSAHESACCFEPLPELLADRFRQLDARFDNFQERAAADSETVRARYSWDTTAQLIIDALEGRNGRDAADRSGDLSERREVQGSAERPES